MITLGDAAVQRFLATRHVAVLATVQADGSPLAMPMWFLHDATSLTMLSVAGTQKVFTEGSMQTTGQPMDLAVVGRGFFQVEAPNGDTLYTENGQLQLNSDGVVVNAQGLPLIPNIEVPAGSSSFTVGSDGTVTAIMAGETQPTQLGQITLVNFTNPAGLEALGGNLYRETVASGQPVEGVPGEDGLGTLKQGVLEGSNVQVVEAMVNMIAIQRAYEANAKVLDAASGMQQFLNQTV